MCSRAIVYFKLGLKWLSLLGITGYRRHETAGYSPALRSVTAPSHEPQPERTSLQLNYGSSVQRQRADNPSGSHLPD